MLIAFEADPTRSYALVAYWPDSAVPYYDWSAHAWVVSMTPACYLHVPPDPASPLPGTTVRVRVPAGFAPAADVELQLLDLAPRVVAVEVLAADPNAPATPPRPGPAIPAPEVPAR